MCITTQLRALAIAAALMASGLPVSAQNADNKSPEQQAQDAANAAKETQKKINEIAEASRLVTGPAGNPECVWLGRRVVSLLWRDDLDTAFRHLDLYDRFGCPSRHIQATFRCLVRQGSTIDPKAQESLNGRVHACWIDPTLVASDAVPSAPTQAPSNGTGAK
jgi:hypothetical protein